MSFGSNYAVADVSIHQLPAAAALAAALAIPSTSLIGNVPMLSNGATLDPQLNNSQGTLLASASRTTTGDSPVMTNYNARGVLVWLNITAITGGPGTGIQMAVFGYEPVSNTYAQITAGTGNKAATGLYGLYVYPGAVTVGGFLASSQPLPRTWGVHVFISDATPYTYSVGYSYIV